MRELGSGVWVAAIDPTYKNAYQKSTLNRVRKCGKFLHTVS